ncbi:hypothetical protein IMZ48_16890 [Candidatus Bathyarchaeota archaeon]|nr:hypothetical protein [Candidatus Bathyarchaeota archaeon]
MRPLFSPSANRATNKIAGFGGGMPGFNPGFFPQMGAGNQQEWGGNPHGAKRPRPE